MTPKGSSHPRLVKRIPADLRQRLVGRKLVIPLAGTTIDFKVTSSTQSIRFSLRTESSLEAKVRLAEAIAYIEQYFEAMRTDRPLHLTHRQITALAGEFYRSWSSGPDGTQSLTYTPTSGEFFTRDNDGFDEEEMIRKATESLKGQAESQTEEDFIRLHGPDIDKRLVALGIPEVTPASRAKLAIAFGKMLLEGLEANYRVAGGDYSPDANLSKFPQWQHEAQAPKPPIAPKPAASLTGLVESWWVEAKAVGKSESTYESYSNTFRQLSKFLGHDDATRVTPHDIVRYKDHRLSEINPRTKKPISVKTVKGSDLTAFKSVFDWAVTNLKVSTNPAASVNIKAGRKVKLRDRDFTEAEATAILTAAQQKASTKLRTQTDFALRWVPWLAAYTGARVGELVQLRREDFKPDGTAWVMTITPEAGTVKGKEARQVPIHEHLVELGLVEFVKSRPEGYLFMTVKPGATFRGVWQSKKNRLQEFARTVVTDPNVAPNHGWRHTFKTRGRGVGIQDSTLDAICGHAPGTIGESYGTVPLKAKLDAIAIFPRYTLKPVGEQEASK